MSILIKSNIIFSDFRIQIQKEDRVNYSDYIKNFVAPSNRQQIPTPNLSARQQSRPYQIHPFTDRITGEPNTVSI